MVNRYIACMLVSVAVASLSQILLKKSTFCKYSSVIREYVNPYVVGGYCLLLVSMLMTVYAYSGVDYKNGPVIESLGNVYVLILSRLFFKERISRRKVVGIACIMLGIAVFYL